MLSIELICLGIASMGCLCLSMKRHSRYTQHIVRRQSLRGAGWFLLAIALIIAVTTQGWGFGLVLLFGVLSLTALMITILISYRPQWLFYTVSMSIPAGLATSGLTIWRNLFV